MGNPRNSGDLRESQPVSADRIGQILFNASRGGAETGLSANQSGHRSNQSQNHGNHRTRLRNQ